MATLNVKMQAPKRESHDNRRAPASVAAALAKDEPNERARALETVCEQWVDVHEWYWREVAECYAFYHGDHYGYWDGVSRSWVATPEAPSDMVRLIVNLTQPIVEQGTSILTQEKVQFGVVAATSEGRDSATSEAGDAVLENGWHCHRMEDLYHKTARDGFICGTGIVHQQWDDRRGRPVVGGIRLKEPEEFDDDTDFSALGPWDIFERIVEPEGDAFLENLLAEEAVPDPAARHPQDGVGMFVRKEIGYAQLYEQFPQLAEADRERQIRGSQGSEPMDRVRRISRLSTRSGDFIRDYYPPDSGMIYTFYHRSTREYPQGYMAIFADGMMLYEAEHNPVYPVDQGPEAGDSWPTINWPVFFHRHLIRENSPWGLGPVAAMVDCQKALNGTWSKTVQHISKIANAKVLLPKGLDVQWTDEQGQVVRVPRTVPPNMIGYVNPANLPPEYGTTVDRAQAYMEYLAGVNAATAGQQPFADTSGRAIQLLQNRDFGRLSPVKQRLDRSWSEVARYYLFLFRRHASNKRKILVVGENKRTVMREFDRSSLASPIDVITFNDQSIPRNPTNRILYMMNLAQSGMLSPDQPGHRELFFELLNLRDFRGFLEHQSPHRNKARRENLRLMQGEMVSVWQGDDHLQHKATIEELILSEEFEAQVQREAQMAGQSPTYVAVMQHWMEHAMYLQQALAPGVPGGGPMNQPGAAPPAATSAETPAPQYGSQVA